MAARSAAPARPGSAPPTDGRPRPAVHAEIPLAEAPKAHEIIESRTNLGKIALIP
ncbi:hypothetical protein [Streptomyces sp. NPDC005336]|uniref:hypothetical protein n=1 Tax=unclassified Streptomyces TaxID=2593676 RepID=UPI0033AD5A15